MRDKGRGGALFMTGLMVMVVFTVMAVVPMAPVAGAPVPSYINGDWVINSNQTYWGGTLEITGSIVVNQGYTLTLHRSTIIFNTDWNWIGLNVQGTLNMYDVTVTNDLMSEYYWYFQQPSSGHIEDCNISNVDSIEVTTSNVVFESNDIHGGWRGIYSNGNNIQPKIYNNTIRDMEGSATGSMVFERNNVTNNAIGGLHVSNTMSFVVRDCELNNNAGKDIMVEAPDTQTKVKLYNSTYGNVVLNSIDQRQKATFTRYWDVDVFVKKASTDRAVAGASVDINKASGHALIEDELTATNGLVKDLWVPEFEIVHQGLGGNNAQTDDFKPHKIEAKATINDQEVTTVKEVEIDQDMHINVTLDDVPPLLVLTSPEDGLQTNETYVTVTGNSEPDVTLMVDGDLTPMNVFGDFFKDIKLDEGNNVIEVSATDPAGNTVGASVTVIKDTIAPYVAILTPKNGTIMSITDPYVTGSSEYGANLRLNGKFVTVMPDGSFNTTIHLAEGENTIKAVAWDLIGNMATDEIIVLLDSKAPTLIIVEPQDGDKTNNPELVIKGVSDKGSTVTINGQLVNLQGSAFQYPWPIGG